MTTGAPATATPSVSSRFNAGNVLREPLLGPLVALFLATVGPFPAPLGGTRLLAGSETYRVEEGPLTFLGTSFRIGSFSTTFGVVVMLLVYLVMWYALSQTAWGKHIYAVGGNPQASNLSGIKSGRVLFSVYVVTGVIAAIAAWAALGRIPNADPNAYQNATLETITAE